MVGLTNLQTADVSAVAGDVTTLLADVAVVDTNVDGVLADTVELLLHVHNRERWFGKLAVQTATDWAENNLTPFRAISGNNVYGADPNDEALVLGTADTPIFAGNTRYDTHDVFVVAASSASVYKLRFVYGAGTMADAIAAGQYSTTMIKIDAAVGATPATVHSIMIPRGTCGATQLWVQAWNATDNATIDFFIGVHEYAV